MLSLLGLSMKIFNPSSYDLVDTNLSEIQIIDHMYGFNKDFKNPILERIKDHNITVWSQYIVNDKVRQQYPNLTFKFDINTPASTCDTFKSLNSFKHIESMKKFQNFVCSFNGANHLSRRFLTAGLHKFGWFNTRYSTKNFSYTHDELDGSIMLYVDGDEEKFYRKFLIDPSNESKNFYESIYTLKYHDDRHNHEYNIGLLSNWIDSSFVQVVGETIAESYHPFMSEKFLYPIVCKSLWVAYAQPCYYTYLEKYFGFKKYNKIFDYHFDSIENPIIRLVELLSMLSKFEKLSIADWHDLYLLENDTIEYNRDHYYSQQYLIQLEQYAG